MALIRIGIAGYMGAGKSSGLHSLLQPAIKIINADETAKWVMQHDRSIKIELLRHFGSTVISTNGRIDSTALGQIVFNSLEKLRELNSIAHPPLLKYLHNLSFDEDLEKVYSCIIVDAALIPLWNIENWFDHLFWIEADHEIRFERLCRKYDGKIVPAELEKRMLLQEKLFNPPTSKLWTIIKNERDSTTFVDKIQKIVSKVHPS